MFFSNTFDNANDIFLSFFKIVCWGWVFLYSSFESSNLFLLIWMSVSQPIRRPLGIHQGSARFLRILKRSYYKKVSIYFILSRTSSISRCISCPANLSYYPHTCPPGPSIILAYFQSMLVLCRRLSCKLVL